MPALELSGVLALKSGSFVGKKLMKINIIKPSGDPMKVAGQMVESLPLSLREENTEFKLS